MSKTLRRRIERLEQRAKAKAAHPLRNLVIEYVQAKGGREDTSKPRERYRFDVELGAWVEVDERTAKTAAMVLPDNGRDPRLGAAVKRATP